MMMQFKIIVKGQEASASHEVFKSRLSLIVKCKIHNQDQSHVACFAKSLVLYLLKIFVWV